MRGLLSIMVLLGAASAWAQQSALDYPSVWTCDRARLIWYCDEDEPMPPPSSVNKPAADKPEAKATLKRIEIKDIRTAEQMRIELKRREDLMVMTPTDTALVKDYLELWQVAQGKGATLADTWRRVVWQNPALDYAGERPVNNAAIKTYDAQRALREEDHLKALAREHGLIFFFKSDCPYCHAMAPVVRELADRHGIDVLAVSIDGGALPSFPQPRDGRRQAAAWGVERVPALFIGSKVTGDRAAIGFGAMSRAEIIHRLFVLTGTEPGKSF